MIEKEGKVDYKALGTRIRADVLKMVHYGQASHVGSSLSTVDLLAVLYGGVLRVDASRPEWPDRDRFILSKGHACAAVYAVLAERGFFPREWLDSYCQNEAHLFGHITHHGVPGVEASTGSLGHGLSIGCGMALAGKRNSQSYRVFVLLSDGECDEGSTWEAAMFAPHHRLDSLVAIVDYNKIQCTDKVKNVLDLDPLGAKWQAFGWAVREIDGHDFEQIEKALLSIPFKPRQPSCIIAHTVKGKGVSFMENQVAWHFQYPDAEQLRQALNELGVSE